MLDIRHMSAWAWIQIEHMQMDDQPNMGSIFQL